MDPQSGTVISSSTVCTLQPSFGIFTDGHGSPSRMYFAKFGGPPISPVDMHDLTRIQPHNLGDLVIYRGWLGVIKRTYEQVTVKFDGGGVAIIGDPDYLEEKGIRLPALLNRVYTEFGRHPHENPDREIKIPAQPGYHGQKVRIPRKVLSKSHWLVGSYNRQMKPEGVVLNIICALVEVDWKLPKVGESNLVKPTKPAQFLDLDVLHSGNIKVYDRSRCPEQAHRIESPNLTIPPWSLSAGDHVKFKDARVAESKYGYSLAGNRQQTIFSVPWTQNALQALMAQVTSTTGEVKVRWQDNSVTQEVSSNLCPYDEVDDHDVWPGEIVSRKDQEYSYDDFTYEVFIRTRAVGVVQSVNAAERVALVRWFDRADITITGEDHDKIVRLHSKLGKITENITEVSVYEVIAHRAITRRRGDIVRITSPEVFCPQHTGHKNTTPSNAQNALFAQGEDGWYGEVVELLLDGQLLVRLGGLENVRDVTCSVLDVDVIESADDDTTESSTGSTDTDMSDGEGGKSRPSLISGSTGNIAETVIEYDGSSPSNADSCHEDQWTTDSDSDVPMKTDKLPSQESQTKSTDETNGQDGDNAGHFIDPLPLNRSKKTQAGASTADATAPTTVPGPASFDILDGPCPEHTFGAPLSGSGKWLKAVLREHQILRSALPEGVFVRAWESSMELMRVLIIGPSGTPYALAPFLFDIHLGEKFPYQAPGVFFHSWTNGIGKVNPNLYEDGKVCLSLLGTWSSEKDNEEWIPFESSILQVIVSLLGLVLVKEPFYSKLVSYGSAPCKPVRSIACS